MGEEGSRLARPDTPPKREGRARHPGDVVRVGLGAVLLLLLVLPEPGRLSVPGLLPTGVAAFAATASGPYLGRPARQLLWVPVWVVAALVTVGGLAQSLEAAAGIAGGWMLGAVLSWSLQAPTGTPSSGVVRAGLADYGVLLLDITPLEAREHGTARFDATDADGRDLFVRVVGPHQRDADWLYRLYCFAVFRTVEDRIAFASPRERVEHEAYLMLLASRGQARVPDVVLAGELGDGSAVVVHERVDGRKASDLPSETFDTALLEDIWRQLAHLHRLGIAHRHLRLANVIVDARMRPWLVDFVAAEQVTHDEAFARDLAELLVGLARVATAEEVVAAAEREFGTGALLRAGAFLQPLALSDGTRQRLRGSDTLQRLSTDISERAGAELPSPAPVTRPRVRPRTVAGLAIAAILIHFMIPQIAELPQLLAALGEASPWWLLLALLLSFAYFGASAVALLGVVKAPLPWGRTAAVQVAAGFAGRVAPTGIGRLGINGRYLQRYGLAWGPVVGALSMHAAAELVVHVALLMVAAVAYGAAGPSVVGLPAGWPLLVAAAVAVALTGGLIGVPAARRRLLRPALRTFRHLWRLLREPRQALLLLAGSFASKASIVLTFHFSLVAVGAGASLGQAATVYLVGGALAAASPTPGGLGVIEATLVAGLTATGIAAAPAVAGVLTFRFLTFWLPIVPGGFTLRALRRRGVL